MNIKDLKPDKNNSNKHTELGTRLLEKSLRKFGGARSIVIDKNNNIVAGNGTVETAMSIGIENVRVIETDGNEIIAVKRIDFDLENDIKTKEYALADNQVAVKNIMIDSEMVVDDLGEKVAEEWVVDQPVQLLGENREVELEDSDASIVFKFAGQEYLNVLDLLKNAEEKLRCGSKEETLLKLLEPFK